MKGTIHRKFHFQVIHNIRVSMFAKHSPCTYQVGVFVQMNGDRLGSVVPGSDGCARCNVTVPQVGTVTYQGHLGKQRQVVKSYALLNKCVLVSRFYS